MRIVLILSLLLTQLGYGQDINPIVGTPTLTYTLSTSANVSAGVYTDEGVLIRTLFSNQPKEAGVYSLADNWDGNDDAGSPAPLGNYSIQVSSGNVVYDWLKPIGNTSLSSSGSTVHHAGQFIGSMVQVGSEMYYTVGYNEIADTHLKFTVGAPNVNATTLKGGGLHARYIATDGNKVYYAGRRGNVNTTFVTAIVPNPGGVETLADFSAGTPYSMETGSSFQYSALDIDTTGDYITGLAVQQTGSYLFVAHSSSNRLNVFDKSTGALIGSITTLTAPREIVVYNSTLWVISGTNTVTKYAINSDNTVALLTLSGLTDPLALAVSPDGSKIAVADRGAFHQVKIYSTSTGAVVETIGQKKSYSDPTVYDDKFFFSNTKFFDEIHQESTKCWLTYQSDGSLWVGDYGNERAQHFAADGSYIDQIQYMGYTYSVQVDPNAPTRVFIDYLEFAVDYADNSWRFVRNWSKNITFGDNGFAIDRMRSVATLSNGRTYALYTPASPSQTREVIELDLATGIRHTGVYLENMNCDLNPDGSVWQTGDNAIGAPAFWKRKVLTGYDENNNPQWSAYVTLETTPAVTSTDPLHYGGLLGRLQQTTSGVIASFSKDNPTTPTSAGSGYHLGGFKNGQWLFKTSPVTRKNYIGDFPTDGAYDIGNGVLNPGTFMQVVDNHIFWGYAGEFWKASQTNMYNHYLDNGLLVGQFGTSLGYLTRLYNDPEAAPADAGNALMGTYVKVGNDIHFFHGDEGQHAGAHHWKISNLNSIQTQTLPIVKVTTFAQPTSDYIDLLAGLPANDSLNLATGRWSFSPAPYVNKTNSGRFTAITGLITYRRGESSIRFFSSPEADGLTRDAYCDLRTVNQAANNFTSWQINGLVRYPELERDDNWLDVLDSTNKIIVRVSRSEVGGIASIKVNNSMVVSGAIDPMKLVMYQGKSISIRKSGDTILVKYGGYTEMSFSAFESGANLANPTTLRWRGHSDDARGHIIDLANLRLYTN